MPAPSLSTAYITALVATVAGLFATQGWITNGTTKFVTGLAAAFVPVILALAHTLFHARVQAAKITTAAAHPARKVTTTTRVAAAKKKPAA